MSKKLVVFPNKDKAGWYEKWTPGRDWLNFPFPSRILLSSRPGSGKTNFIKNILLKAKPYYKRVFLCHFDLETKEYDDVETIKLPDIPNAKNKNFNPKHKSILIIDDYEFENLSKDQKNNLDRLWGYTSTHKGLTIICATQNFFNLPPAIRRMTDVFVIWKGSSDFDSLYMIGRRLGMNKKDFGAIMDHCKTKFDNITFDLTPDSPCNVRLNGYECIIKDLLNRKSIKSTDQVDKKSNKEEKIEE